MNIDQVRKVLEFLRGRLGDSDYEKVKKFIVERHDDSTDDEASMLVAGGTKLGLDQLPPRVRQQTIDAIINAQRGREDSYARMFPGAARIGVA